MMAITAVAGFSLAASLVLLPGVAFADTTGTLFNAVEQPGPSCDDGSTNNMNVEEDTNWDYGTGLNGPLTLTGISNAQELCQSEHGTPPTASSIGLTDNITANGIDISSCTAGSSGFSCNFSATQATANYSTTDNNVTFASHNFLAGGMIIDGDIHFVRETATGSFNFFSSHYQVSATATATP
jgi:hypothetical protein